VNQLNGDNPNNIRYETSRYFRNKKKDYLKDKINELQTRSMNKKNGDMYSVINELKMSYQPTTILVKDEEGDLLADSHVLNRWKNYSGQELNLHEVNDIRQIEIYAAEPFIPQPSPAEVAIAIETLIRYKTPGTIKFRQN
jgi:hypothetical protein